MLRLDWCSHEAAKYAVERWHYSRQLPNQKLVRVGVWESGEFVGCVIFGDGANPGMFAPYGVGYEHGAELVRIAMRPHRTPVSRVVSIAVSLLKRRCPGLRILVSFADPEYGHHGGIYQASNWIYTGTSLPADEYIVNGVRMHGRALRSTRSTHGRRDVPAKNVHDWAQKILDPHIKRVTGSAKHRYVLPLDDEMRARIAPLARPYPKREQKADSGRPPQEAEAVQVRPARSKPEVA